MSDLRTSDPSLPAGPSDADRRIGERHLTYYPIHIRPEGGPQVLALVYDLSVSGARVLTRARLDVGEIVTLSLDLRRDAEARLAPARVVRSEERSPDCSDVWPYSSAVHFEPPVADLEEEMRELARRQSRV